MTQTISAERIEEMLADAKAGASLRGEEAREVLALARSTLRAQAQGGEAVAVIRFNHGPGTENDMPTVVSCDWRPNGDYSLYASPPVQAQPQGDDTDMQWRDLALQFDEHRIQALEIIRAMLRGGFEQYAKDFLAAPPLPGEIVLAQRLSALATSPAPVDGGVRHAFRNADESDWQHLFAVLPDTGRGKFWQAVMKEARAALTASRAAVAQDETP